MDKIAQQIFNFDDLKSLISKTGKTRVSAWDNGVNDYVDELIDVLMNAYQEGRYDPTKQQSKAGIQRVLLNGARDWGEASEGGAFLVADVDIAKRLCSPSELKKTDNGRRKPNSRETWLDVQARALYQASEIVTNAAIKYFAEH